jgi:CxxC-x17-CxxC domain-containing protein
MSERVSTEIKCSDCGKTATVPFKPAEGKPVYCSACLGKHHPPKTGFKKQVQTRPYNSENEKNVWSRRRVNWK